MTPFAWLLGLFLPACGAVGAAGLPVPPPADIARIERPATPNTALAAPAGFAPAPDIVTPLYPVTAERLYGTVRNVALAAPRTFLAAEYPDRLQLHFVARSAVFNFPDLVLVQVAAAGPDASTLVLYSRSVYGRSDLGVNRKRVEAWLAALNAKLPTAAKDQP
jgi:uncharacterized protein (DUF1499 family)